MGGVALRYGLSICGKKGKERVEDWNEIHIKLRMRMRLARLDGAGFDWRCIRLRPH